MRRDSLSPDASRPRRRACPQAGAGDHRARDTMHCTWSAALLRGVPVHLVCGSFEERGVGERRCSGPLLVGTCLVLAG